MFPVQLTSMATTLNSALRNQNICRFCLCSQTQTQSRFFSSKQPSTDLPSQRKRDSNDYISKAGTLLRKVYPALDRKEKHIEDKEPEPSPLIGRDLVSLKDLQKSEIHQLLWTAHDLKTKMKDSGESFQPLKGKTAALVFQNDNIAARLSAELGIAKLGGHATHVKADQAGVHGFDNWNDVAMLMSGSADMIVGGINNHKSLEDMANVADVPVITAYSNLLQPLPILAYFFTLQEFFGYLRGVKIAWVGDGNSVCNSLLFGCAKLGIDLNIATPIGYEPNTDVMLDATRIAGKTGASLNFGNDPVRAVYRADAIITTPYAQPEDSADGVLKRAKDFKGFQLQRKMLEEAGHDWMILHDLPRSTTEITDDLFYGGESHVKHAIENRLWITMAVMLNLLTHYNPSVPKPKYVRG